MVSSSTLAASCSVSVDHLQTLGMIRSWLLTWATVGCRWEQLQVKHIWLKKEFTSEVGRIELTAALAFLRFVGHRPFIFFSGCTHFNLSWPLCVQLDVQVFTHWVKYSVQNLWRYSISVATKHHNIPIKHSNIPITRRVVVLQKRQVKY